MKNKKWKASHTVLVVVGTITLFAVIYIGFAIYFQSHFCFGTILDGINVGGYSVEKTEALIKKEIAGYSLKLTGREGAEEILLGSDIQIAPVFNGEVEQQIRSQDGFSWIVTLFQKEELELQKVVTYDEKALEQALRELSIVKPERQREPVDASYSEYQKGEGYTLVAADYGTVIDLDALKHAVGEAVSVLADELDLDAAGCYREPAVGDDDAGLLGLLEQMNRYVGTTVTYEFGEDTEVLDGKTTHEWIQTDGMTAFIDEEQARAYVKALGKKYNTAYQPKTLKTSYGTEVTISNGHYGWRIDNDGETEQLLADLEGGEPVKREPVYLQRANSHGENDYGDSYVEINLTAQHLFLYENGNLIVESDFVSGDESKGHSTPTGAFGLTYKTRDAVLRGEDYATPVKYWMPYAGDVGMHDASWRRSFGGGIYLTNGSHGCINLPSSVAKQIYEVVDKGYAVLVYKLPGTESAAVLQQKADGVVNLINTIGTVTLQSEPVIVAARTQYNELPQTAKDRVTNYDVLVAAEAALAQLKAAQPQEGQQP